MKALVVYYSHSGNTRRLAEQIAQESGGVLLELVPQNPYPAAYRALVTQATRELREGVLPALSGELPKIDGFDVVFIGTPNWCGTAAPPVFTYLSQTDLRGRRVAPFCTHGGGAQGISAQMWRTPARARRWGRCWRLPALRLSRAR